MKKARMLFISALIAAAALLSQTVCAVKSGEAADLAFRLAFTETVSKTPVSGRIIIGFQSDPLKSVDMPDPLNPQLSLAWDVRDWKPGESLILKRSEAEIWPDPPDLPEGWYAVQAVLKANQGSRSLNAEGNAVTNKNVIRIDDNSPSRPIDLLVNIPARKRPAFKETEFIKEVNFESALLTRFYGEPEPIQAAVILPESYFNDPGKRYPSVYVMGGVGATHFDALSGAPQKRYGMSGFGREKIFVFVNIECRSGWHNFVTSETNGPREETFFQELVPFIEKEYRVDPDPRTRFLMGQSSGAWAALWLLIRRPDRFGGAYAGSPDPVDFTEFIGTNIYEDKANVFFAPDGALKVFNAAAGAGSFGRVSLKDFTAIDRIAGRGEQMYSFDATFSKKGPDGEPRRLFDWHTGAVDQRVASFYGAYDLSRVVSGSDRNVKDLLADKIHVYVAADDDFGLDLPVRAFHKALESAGVQADLRFLESGGHAIWTDEVRKTIHEDMDRKIAAAEK
jgi:pimeloyl-ACP methyl ester carboxylesterase